jgi:hypothetical protein
MNDSRSLQNFNIQQFPIFAIIKPPGSKTCVHTLQRLRMLSEVDQQLVLVHGLRLFYPSIVLDQQSITLSN